MAEEQALGYHWPGNVRELRNRLERAVALADGDWITASDLFPDTCQVAESAAAVFPSLSDVRDAAEQRQIKRALVTAGGQMAETARLLGVSRTTLWEKMRRWGLTDKAGSEI
jgi:transcriptional regulator of acetoin/glycerol metabolism